MFLRYRHIQLLSALSLLLILGPFVGRVAGFALVDLLLLLTLVSAVVACATRRRHLVVGIGWAFAYALLDQLAPDRYRGFAPTAVQPATTSIWATAS